MALFEANAPEEIEEMLAFLADRNISLQDLKTVFPELEPMHGSYSADMSFKDKYAEIMDDLQMIQSKMMSLAVCYMRDTKHTTQEQ